MQPTQQQPHVDDVGRTCGGQERVLVATCGHFQTLEDLVVPLCKLFGRIRVEPRELDARLGESYVVLPTNPSLIPGQQRSWHSVAIGNCPPTRNPSQWLYAAPL